MYHKRLPLLAIPFLILALAAALAFTMTGSASHGTVTHSAFSEQPANPEAETPHPILSDQQVRRALAYCTDRDALIQSVYPYLDQAERDALRMDTFIPKNHWAYTAPSVEYTYPFSPTLGQKLLDNAGWILQPGNTYRTNAAGYELAFEFTTTTAAFRQTWAAVFEQQLRDHCGIRIVRNHIPASLWFGDETGLQRRDFELGAYAWVGQMDPGGESLYACDQIPTPENNWQGQNYMGWCNPAASDAIIQANHTLLRQERIDQYAIVQEEFAKDMVSLPLFNRTSYYAADADLVNFIPNSSEIYYNWNVYSWTIPATDTIRIGWSQEPASLFTLVESTYVAQFAAHLIYGFRATSLDYDYQPHLYQSVPTLENGGAVTSTVNVAEGTWVMDAGGSVITLTPGVQVIDAGGNVITYTGGNISMTQLAITASALPGMFWSDGSPLIQADLELWDAIHCDYTSGATSYYLCEMTEQREYLSDTTVRTTLVPGAMPSDYSIIGPGAYPSERILGDGRKLKDVPAAEWATLPEIAVNPIGLGPYRIVEWEYGIRMVFERNPYFALGLPTTQNIEILFFPPEQLETALVSGTVDILDPSGIAGISEYLQNAEDAGIITIFPIANATWEHIDMNLGLYTQLASMPIPTTGGVMTTSMGVSLDFPAGVFTETVTVLFNSLLNPSNPAPGEAFASFTLEALDANGQPVQPQAPFTLTVAYDDSNFSAQSIDERTVNIYFWDGSLWQPLMPCDPCELDLVNNRITVTLDHFSEFTLTAQKWLLYLPVVMK